jgi:hypothetical protein
MANTNTLKKGRVVELPENLYSIVGSTDAEDGSFEMREPHRSVLVGEFMNLFNVDEPVEDVGVVEFLTMPENIIVLLEFVYTDDKYSFRIRTFPNSKKRSLSKERANAIQQKAEERLRQYLHDVEVMLAENAMSNTSNRNNGVLKTLKRERANSNSNSNEMNAMNVLTQSLKRTKVNATGGRRRVERKTHRRVSKRKTRRNRKA